jgi:hypothetical protein
MEHNRTETRRTFLERAAAVGLLAAGGSFWSAAPAGAKQRPKPPVWTPTRRSLTGPFANPLFAVAADPSSKTVYFAKCDGDGAIQGAQSHDDGGTFGAFKTIPGISNASDVPLDLPLVVDDVTKRVHLLYSADVDDSSRPASLLHTYSDNRGASWSKPLTLDDGVSSTGLNHGTNRFIRVAIAAHGGVVHVGWTSIDNTTFLTDGMFYARSSNGGDSFSAPVQPFPRAISPSRPDIATIGKTVLFTWTDARFGSAYNGNPGEVIVGRSTDGGSTWSERRLTFSRNVWGAGMTLRPVICAGPDGTVTIVWQAPNTAPVGGAGGVTNHDSPGTEDLYWIHSRNGGISWGKIGVLVHAASTQNHAYVVQRSKVVVCVWSDARSSPRQIRAKVSSDGGATFGPAMHPMMSTADAIAPRVIAARNSFQIYASEGTNGVFQARLGYQGAK